MKHASKTIKKSEKTSRRRKVVLSPGKIMIKIPVSLAAASTAGLSTGTSSTHDVPVVEMDDEGALMISLGSLPSQDDTSGL